MEERNAPREIVPLSRRRFLQWSAAIGAAGCAAQAGFGAFRPLEAQAEEPNGEWRNASCWFDCGGNCVNQAYVKDGAVLYQRTDVSGDDTPDMPQQRGHSGPAA